MSVAFIPKPFLTVMRPTLTRPFVSKKVSGLHEDQQGEYRSPLTPCKVEGSGREVDLLDCSFAKDWNILFAIRVLGRLLRVIGRARHEKIQRVEGASLTGCQSSISMKSGDP